MAVEGIKKYFLKKLLLFLLVTIGITLGYFFVFPYFQWVLSPFSFEEADLNHDGILSPTEVDYIGNYGVRSVVVPGKQDCVEYFAFKDGLPIKSLCK